MIWDTDFDAHAPQNGIDLSSVRSFRALIIDFGVMPIAMSHEKGIYVASQTLNELEIDTSESFYLRDILPGAAWAPFGTDARELPNDMDYAWEARVEEENCPRGLMVALGIEFMAGLVAYGVWHAAHFIR